VHDKLAEDGNSPQLLLRDVDSPPPPPQHHPPPLEMVTRTNTNKVEAPKYEAFMMTGDRVIKMSKNSQVRYFLFLIYFYYCIVCIIINSRYPYYLRGIEKLIVW